MNLEGAGHNDGGSVLVRTTRWETCGTAGTGTRAVSWPPVPAWDK